MMCNKKEKKNRKQVVRWWKVVGLFVTSSKRGSGQMACTVWRLASVNDQAEAQKGPKKKVKPVFLL